MLKFRSLILALSLVAIGVGFYLLATTPVSTLKSGAQTASIASQILTDQPTPKKIDLSDSSKNAQVDPQINGQLLNNRYLVVGDFPKGQIESIIGNLEVGLAPGSEYSAGATSPFAPDDPRSNSPLAKAAQEINRTDKKTPLQLQQEALLQQANAQAAAEREKFPALSEGNRKFLEGSAPGQDPARCTDLGPLPDCPTKAGLPRYGPQGQIIACIVCFNNPSGETPDELVDTNICYTKRDGTVHCARSPAWSISPYRDKSIPGPAGACGYNVKKGEQTGEDLLPWDDIGFCRDKTHSAWTPCGPGTNPIGHEEETRRGEPLRAPPAITAGGCSSPCFCTPLPSGHCKSNLWCVGPPGCTCCPGLACNVCCGGEGYLWDAVTGWCGCAADPSQQQPPKRNPSL